MSYYGVEEQVDAMKGRKIASVVLDDKKETITFTFQDGHMQAFGVEGDCCSSSWIEHLTLPGDVVGATLTGLDELSEDKTDDEAMNPKQPPLYEGDEYEHREHESLQVYQTKFKTDRGDIVLEYRNSSNGYYGGYLVCK